MSSRHVNNERVKLAADFFHTIGKGMFLAGIVSPAVNQDGLSGGFAAAAALVFGAVFMHLVAHAILGMLERDDD